MQLVAVLCVSSFLLLASVEGRGAGRAFPIDSENYAISSFTRLNSRLEWDPTNFLVDLAGYYANCDSAGTRSRTISVDKLTPDGQSISGVVDSIDGSRADVDAVNGYIKAILDDWLSRRTYDSLIRGAQAFGCSVRPGCSGSAVVSCLFSPGGSGEHPAWTPADQPDNIVAVPEVHALAFTPEQYETTELFTGNKWDRSHFLENLSGMETKCGMIGNDDWPFTDLRRIEAEYGIRIVPLYGSSLNLGSTQAALDAILPGFKSIRSATELGCSLIPDCEVGPEMYVVVTCLYREE